MKDYEEAKRILLATLTPRERVILRKQNPRLKHRNRLLTSLKSEGVSYPILRLASGLSLTALYNIVRKSREKK